jgi:hypothetical protein
MSSDSKNSDMNDRSGSGNDPKRENERAKTGQQSQDALRHQQDARHHKFHNGPLPGGADDKTGQKSQARAQQDSVDIQSDGQQPEVPKVGSRDALGG